MVSTSWLPLKLIPTRPCRAWRSGFDLPIWFCTMNWVRSVSALRRARSPVRQEVPESSTFEVESQRWRKHPL